MSRTITASLERSWRRNFLRVVLPSFPRCKTSDVVGPPLKTLESDSRRLSLALRGGDSIAGTDRRPTLQAHSRSNLETDGLLLPSASFEGKHLIACRTRRSLSVSRQLSSGFREGSTISMPLRLSVSTGSSNDNSLRDRLLLIIAKTELTAILVTQAEKADLPSRVPIWVKALIHKSWITSSASSLS